jgi:drug/metabolite transporter (DMT)-like permease
VKTALDLRAVAALLALCGSWGLNQVAIKVSLWGIPPALLMGGRSLVAAVLVFLWCLLRRKRMFHSDGTLLPGLIVGLLFAGEFLLLFWGLQLTTASRAVVFLYLAPFVVAVGGHFLLGERLGVMKLVGLLCAFLGLVLAFSDQLLAPSDGSSLGDALCFGAAILWGLTIVLIKATALARAPAEKTLLYQLVVSAIAGFGLALALGERIELGLAAPVLSAFLYQAVWVAAITYVAWFGLIRDYPASLLTSFTFLTPLFGVAFGAAILGESLSPGLLAALLLVAVGIYLVNRGPGQHVATEAA